MNILTRQQLAAINWGVVESKIRAIIEQSIQASGTVFKDIQEAQRWANGVTNKISVLLNEETGLPSLDYAHQEAGWCGCHKMFQCDQKIDRDVIPASTESALDAAHMTYDYFSALRDFFDANKLPQSASVEEIKATLTSLINLTIDLTNVDSSWYFMASENVSAFIAENLPADQIPESVAEFVDNIVESKFASWSEPEPATVDEVVNEIVTNLKIQN